jgi:hypothetical protein
MFPLSNSSQYTVTGGLDPFVRRLCTMFQWNAVHSRSNSLSLVIAARSNIQVAVAKRYSPLVKRYGVSAAPFCVMRHKSCSSASVMAP